MKLDFYTERAIEIGAPPEIVFRYFRDPVRFAAWWGSGSEIDCRPGGRVRIRYPDGTVASGEVLEIEDPSRIVFTYGYEGEGKPIAPGASRVTVTLSEVESGTLVHLRHDVPTAGIRDAHVAGWRYQMALFANVVSAEVQANAAERIDAFFAAWSENDPARRRALLESSSCPDVSFRDRHGHVDGIGELDEFVAAVLRFMPGVTLSRSGDVRQCQGTAVCGWRARGADGSPRSSGIFVFDLGPDGKITRAVGLADA
jgi:uncharacterized protein YndB with AHSA1/START domain